MKMISDLDLYVCFFVMEYACFNGDDDLAIAAEFLKESENIFGEFYY